MQALSAWNVANFQAPGRKASVQYKPYCLHKQIRHAEPQPCSALRESLMLTYRTVYSPACTCGPRSFQIGLSNADSLGPAQVNQDSGQHMWIPDHGCLRIILDLSHQALMSEKLSFVAGPIGHIHHLLYKL